MWYDGSGIVQFEQRLCSIDAHICRHIPHPQRGRKPPRQYEILRGLGDTSPTPQRGRKLLFHRDNFPRLPDTSPTPNGTKTPRLYHTFQTQSTHPLPFTGASARNPDIIPVPPAQCSPCFSHVERWTGAHHARGRRRHAQLHSPRRLLRDPPCPAPVLAAPSSPCSPHFPLV